MSNDGFIDWAWSSEPALESGSVLQDAHLDDRAAERVPGGRHQRAHERVGTMVPASVRFRFAEAQVQLREMKISADQYDSVLTLLCLPHAADFWLPDRVED